MYPPVAEIKEFLKKNKDKPFICCEYTHAMGNSCGGMHLYTDLTDTEPLYQGGFIWDYIDQSILKKDRYGDWFEAYEGDFHDRPSDYFFSGNGITYGDRTPSPKMQEVKFNYSNIAVDFKKNEFRVINKNLFTDLSGYDTTLCLLANGEEIHSSEIQCDVKPLSSKVFAIPSVISEKMLEYEAGTADRGTGIIRLSEHRLSRWVWPEMTAGVQESFPSTDFLRERSLFSRSGLRVSEKESVN